MWRIVWNRKTKPLLFRFLIFAVFFQILIVFVFYKNPEEQDSIFFDYNDQIDFMKTCKLSEYDYNKALNIEYETRIEDGEEGEDGQMDIGITNEILNGKWTMITTDKAVECKGRCHYKDGMTGEWMEPGDGVDCGIFEVKCTKEKEDVFGYLYGQVIKMKKEENKTTDGYKPSIIVISIDNLSTGYANRHFPSTLQYLSDGGRSVRLPYLNKISEHKYGNQAALWFGKLLTDIDYKFFDGNKTTRMMSISDYCDKMMKDNYSNIFQEFKNNGYVTFLGQQLQISDDCQVISSESIDYSTDLYHKSMSYCDEITRKTMNNTMRENRKHVMEYTKDILEQHKNTSLFAWIQLSYDGLTDKQLEKFIKDINELAPDSFVFILGESGLNIYEAEKVHKEVMLYEMNNPFFSISVPLSHDKRNELMEQLEKNKMILQSHLNVRASLLDINQMNSLSTNDTNQTNQSLFGKLDGKVCADMGISAEFCICQTQMKKVNRHILKQDISRSLTKQINKILVDNSVEDYCESIATAEIVEIAQYNNRNVFSVIAQLSEPSHFIFRTIVNRVNNSLEFGMIHRLDDIDNRSDCIQNIDMKQYCYCIPTDNYTIINRVKMAFQRNINSISRRLFGG